jgi:uncharacterized protein
VIRPDMVVACKQAIAFQIEEDALEKMLQVEQTIAAPFEHLEFVVQTFNKAAVVTVDEIVDDFLPPPAEGVDELIKAAQPTFGDAFDPGPDPGFGGGRGDVLVKNVCQLLLQIVGLLQFRRVAEKEPEGASFFGGQISGLLAQGPHTALQLLVLDVWKLLFQSSQFLFTQVVQTISVRSGDMETINHNAHVAQLFPHCFAKAFVHVTTHGMDALFQALWDGTQEFDDGILLAIWQNRQDHHSTFRQARRHNRHIVAVAFLERNFIQPDHAQGGVLPPIHAGADPPLQDTQDAVIGHTFFAAHIFHRRIDQLQQQVIIIHHTMRTVTLPPAQLLRGGRMSLTFHALVAPGSIAQIARPPEDRQVTDDRPFIIPMSLFDLSPTLAADRPFFAALDGDDQLANFVDFCAQYPHIGYIQRYRDLCSTKSRSQLMVDRLRDLQASSPDIEASAVVSVDGLPIATALPQGVEEDRVAAMSAAMLSLGERIASELGRGSLDQVYIKGEDGYVILMSVGEEAVLTALAREQAKLGLIFLDMRRATEALEKLI